MDIVSLLLGPEALFAFAATVSLAIVMRALTGFARQATELSVRLQDVQVGLDRLHAAIPEKKARADQLRRGIQPLKDLEQQMRAHYATLRHLDRQEERKRQQEREGTRLREIQIHRPGIPGL